MGLQTLVLNADFRPLSVHPVSVWDWRDAVTALLSERVDLVAEYDQVIHSPSLEMRVPSVVALKNYQRIDAKAAFTRFNIYCRDRWTCQYCNQRFRSEDLTFDHVHPRSRGGGTCWENIVAACSRCNLRKANKTPKEAGMQLLRAPYVPTRRELASLSAARGQANIHHSWMDFLYWDSVLDVH